MSMKLRELIKGVRSCKTAQEEREAIAKECALIRTSFKEGENSYRARNVAKLLYIHMLGYPTHFGQMECLKLIASPKFHEKRVGYLGLTQLLDENTEILMLVTNSIKNDINNPNPFISGTALCALGNIGNHEMCLALSREVQAHLSVDNPLIRKKAALCAMRIIKKVDDIEDKFNSSVTALLEDKNHGVMLASCSLLVHLLEANPEYISEFKHVPSLLIKTLKAMLMSGYANAAEYDFGGVVDPFLQVKILKLVRLFAGDEQINDLLAQIATNTDASKNAGNAVLYECVQTIMALPGAENGLRVLGINILGKFLANKDSNIKYVALQMFQQIVAVDLKSVQRHRSTVLACLRDSDVSIRRRALDVASSLVTADNAQSVIAELMGHLAATHSSEEDLGFRGDLASRICVCIDKYAPDRKWHVDNTLRVLLLAGNDVGEEVVYSMCHVVAAGNTALHQYAATKMFYTLCEPPEAEPRDSLTMAGVWILGEFGHLVPNISFGDMLDLMDALVKEALLLVADQRAAIGSTSGSVVCEYIACCVTKQFVKSSSSLTPRVVSFLRKFEGSLFVDLQQRVCEFLEILKWDPQTRGGLLDAMPVRLAASAMSSGTPTDAVPSNAPELLAYIRGVAAEKPHVKVRSISTKKTEERPAVKTADLFDLLGEETVIPAAAVAPKIISEDLLNDMFA